MSVCVMSSLNANCRTYIYGIEDFGVIGIFKFWSTNNLHNILNYFPNKALL